VKKHIKLVRICSFTSFYQGAFSKVKAEQNEFACFTLERYSCINKTFWCYFLSKMRLFGAFPLVKLATVDLKKTGGII